MHLISSDSLMKDRINYRKGCLICLADMKHLEEKDPEIWHYFLKGYFYIQTSPIPDVAIGADHVGE